MRSTALSAIHSEVWLPVCQYYGDCQSTLPGTSRQWRIPHLHGYCQGGPMKGDQVSNTVAGNILIVDDMADNLRLLSAVLAKRGYTVRQALNGRMALTAVRASPPDLILLDVMMPEMNGYEVCQQLQADETTCEIPVIFISAFEEVPNKVKAFALGGVDYITKPFQVEEVLARVENQLTLRSTKAEIRQLNRELEQRVQQRTAQLESTNCELKREINERIQAEEALAKSEEQFRLTFELAPIGMALLQLDGRFLRVNRALCGVLGYTANELLSRFWQDITHPDDRTAGLIATKQLFQEEISHFQIESRYLTKGSKVIHAVLAITLVRDSQGKPLHFIAQTVDITDRKHAEEQLIHDALHDSLTGLPNRTLFMERVERSIEHAKRHKDYQFAVLFIDFDRFKLINDSLGHLVGDQLLCAIARLLEECLRTTDTVARLGGDEFTILLEDIKDIQDATRIADRIARALMSPLSLQGQEVFTSASIGIATSDTGYDRGADVLRDADIAMYRAKERGKSRYEVFDQAMHARTLRLLQLETDLRRTIEHQELRIYYQPITSLISGTLIGFEALIRWQHPEQGLVCPDEFIPIAEETGLIVPIGHWVLHEACRQMRAWQTKFPSASDLKIGVNLSGKQLREVDLLEQIDRVLGETGLDAQNLQLEITESMLMDNAEAVTDLLSKIRARKIRLSVDDFGTGYSSLSYLHRFPVDTLKIDRSFVSRIGIQGENLEIVRAIVSLARNLNMSAIAEGVETAEQLDQLRTLGCEFGQGYFFARPLDCHAATTMLATNPQW